VTTVEDRTRAAMDAITGLVESVPPLPLPPPAGAGSRGLAPPLRRRRAAWLAPAAAAAAVLVIAVTLVIVRDIPNGQPVPGKGIPASGGVPRYYVTLYLPPSRPARPGPTGQPTCIPGLQGCPNDLLVGDTATGAKLAILRPPRDMTFEGIAAAADDRTFVADTQPATGVADSPQLRRWYLLRITPGGSPPVRLTRLPIPAASVNIAGLALSGSGRQLAVATQENGVSQVRIYSVRTGVLMHTWATKDRTAFGSALYFGAQSRALAWIGGDRAVAFTTSGIFVPAGLLKAETQLAKQWQRKKLRPTLLEIRKQVAPLIKKYGAPAERITWRRPDGGQQGHLVADGPADGKLVHLPVRLPGDQPGR
jgi:hypothetical protein